MNVEKLVRALSGLSGLTVLRAVISPGELSDSSLPLFLRLEDGRKLGFVENLGQNNIPDDWETVAKNKEVAFVALTEQTIGAAREGLCARICKCKWMLSAPSNLREQLLEQGLNITSRVEEFLTTTLRWQINICDLRFHVLLAESIPLTTVVSEDRLRKIFAQCKT